MIPETLPGPCHDRGIVALTWAATGQPYDPQALDGCRLHRSRPEPTPHARAFAVEVPGRLSSGNWPICQLIADIIAGHQTPAAALPFLKSWGLNGIEMGSTVYWPWNIGAVILLLAEARKKNWKVIVKACEAWLRACWAYMALQALPQTPTYCRFNKTGKWSDRQAMRVDGYRGPYVGCVGDRSAHNKTTAANTGYIGVSMLSSLFAAAAGLHFSGSFPIEWADGRYRTWPAWAVAHVTGKRFGDPQTKGEAFGLTGAEQATLRKVVRSPDRLAPVREVLSWLTLQPLHQRSKEQPAAVQVDRYQWGYVSHYTRSQNGSTFGATQAVISIERGPSGGNFTEWFFPARHSAKGKPYGSSTSYCALKEETLSFRVPDDGVSFRYPINYGRELGELLYSVTYDGRGARFTGDAQAPAEPEPPVVDPAPEPPADPEPPTNQPPPQEPAMPDSNPGGMPAGDDVSKPKPDDDGGKINLKPILQGESLVWTLFGGLTVNLNIQKILGHFGYELFGGALQIIAGLIKRREGR